MVTFTSPSFIFLLATPIAMQYPLVQSIMFLTLLIGTSPLYFIMITFTSPKSGKAPTKRIRHLSTSLAGHCWTNLKVIPSYVRSILPEIPSIRH